MHFLHFSLTSNADEILDDKIIEHAYLYSQIQPRDQRGVKIV